jgi:NodT family efflux transporter outer membrane factor (OMF) lipoprotein
MNKTLIAIALVAVQGLSGCATPTPQALNSTSVPSHFDGSKSPVPAWPDTKWWSSFGDAELASLVAEALANNRDVATAVARIDQVQAQVKIGRAALFPQVNAQAGYARGGCRGAGCNGFSSTRTFNLDGSVSYNLDAWGLTRDNIRSSQELLKVARFSSQAVSLAVAANTADQYFAVLAVRQRIAIAHENIRAINAILSVIQLRVKAGSSSHLDLAREQAQLEGVESQLSSLEIAQSQALHALAVLVGRPPEGFGVSGQSLSASAPPALSPGLPSELLTRRPDIAEAEARLAAAHADLDAARAAFLPQISLTGSGGIASAALGTLLSGPGSGYAIGAQLLQTIFDGGRLRGQKALASASQRAAVAQYQGAVLNAFADAEDALSETANTAHAQEHLKREVEAAREAFEISQLQYQQGTTDLLNVLQAQQTLFSAEDALAQAALANNQAAIHLYQALGGGWIEAPAERTQFIGEGR